MESKNTGMRVLNHKFKLNSTVSHRQILTIENNKEDEVWSMSVPSTGNGMNERIIDYGSSVVRTRDCIPSIVCIYFTVSSCITYSNLCFYFYFYLFFFILQ